MKHLFRYLLATSLVVAGICSSSAQTITANGISVSDIKFNQAGNQMNVDMIIDMSDLHIKSNKSLRVTPFITNGQQMIQLPSVIIDGRRRSIVHERGEISPDESADIFIRRKNRKQQSVDYAASVTFEPWMSNSELILREEWCSCHDMPMSEDLMAVAQMHQPSQSTTTPSGPTTASTATPSSQAKPKMAYAIPSSDIASQSTHDAMIYFKINQSTIDDTYMNNKQTIESLRNIVAGGSEITAIKLMGYASPEGPYTFNENLAKRRATAVKDYMAKNNIDSSIPVTTDSAPIDWQELKQMLNDSKISNYLKIIAIIDDANIKPADKNAAIRKAYPVEYNFMLRTWYPKLRKVDISIEHKQKPLDVASAKQQLKVDPTKLSLGELYMIAQTYEKGSKEWDDIILLAVQNYPNVAEARVNAANVAMANGNYSQAAAYLQGLPDTMPEAMNSRGILAMSEGKYSQALALFEAAQKAGVSEATYNISLVKQLMQLKS